MTATRPPLVLLADDDDDLRAVLADILREQGPFEVLEVRDGQAALEALRVATSLGAAVIDHRMPGLTGAVVVRRARAEGVSVPMVLISAAANLASLADAHGVSIFLAKPFGSERFITVVRRALAGASGSPT